jgi:hypothetical protein
MKPREITIDYIFENSIPEPNTGCWLWLGTMQTNGYGRVFGEGSHRGFSAHRKAYEAAYDCTIPSTMQACHRCDTKLCVNPAHIFVGTKSDNMRDCARKGRNAMQRRPERSSLRRPGIARACGERQGSARLTSTQVAEIRRLRGSGVSSSEIARLFGVTAGHARKVGSGKLWPHITAALATEFTATAPTTWIPLPDQEDTP